MQRRHFISTLAGAAAILALRPSTAATSRDRTLLLIELAGGNDGLNTFIPYNDPNYRTLRPTLGIQDGISVSSTVALHPALASWEGLLESGTMAVVQNVGYPNPDLSHFRSKEIWQSGSLDPSPDTGWLGRYLDAEQAQSKDGIFLGSEYPLALNGSGAHYLHVAPNLVVHANGSFGQALQTLYNDPQPEPLAEAVRLTVLESTEAVKALTQDLDRRLNRQNYPQGPLGQQFALVSRIVESGASVVYLTVGGWDTHTNQTGRHERLLTQLGQGVEALYQHLHDEGLDQQVLIMIQSEFGRRPAENGSGGTDHGTAGPVILVGSQVQGGFYGGDPALDSLVNQNLPMQIDFRSLYSEILAQWLQADPTAILGSEFEHVGILS